MRLNLGAGGTKLNGWTSIDRAGEVDVIHDLIEPLPYESNTAEGAVAHHVLDQLTYPQLETLFGEVRRVLKPGSMFRVSCADLDQAIDAALKRNPDWFPVPHGNLEESLGWFITDGGARRTRLNPERMRRLFETGGFAWCAHQDVRRTLGPDWLVDLDSRSGESFYIEGAK